MTIKLDMYGIILDDSQLDYSIKNGVAISVNLDTGITINFEGWELIRSIRRYYLSASDWTQMADAPLSDNQKALWQAYRQALRDIPQVYTNYTDVVFPSIPTEA